MKRLIVNADDFGISERRNRGIVEAHLRGIVTSVSLLANGVAWGDALRRLQEAPKLDVGLHLNLSEGEPVVREHRTLVEEGSFYGKERTRRLAALWRFNPDEVAQEVTAQLRKLLDAGLRVTHLDSHQHLHVWRPLAEPIARVAKRFGIPYIRSPKDRWSDAPGVPMRRAVQAEEYRRRTEECQAIYSEYGLRSPDHFGGSALSGYLTLTHLAAIVRSLPEGTTEFMVHPGYADEAEGFSGPDRERELRVLTDPGWPQILQDQGVEPTDFGKL